MPLHAHTCKREGERYFFQKQSYHHHNTGSSLTAESVLPAVQDISSGKSTVGPATTGKSTVGSAMVTNPSTPKAEAAGF